MSLKVKVKAAGIKNLTDARYFAAAGVDWIGFCFDQESADYLNPATAQAIIKWIEGPEIVGEFGNESPEQIEKLKSDIGFGIVQVSGDQKSAFDRFFREIIPIGGIESIEPQIDPRAEVQVINFRKAGTAYSDLKEKDLKKLKELGEKYKIIVEIKVSEAETESLCDQAKPFGLQFQGGFEIKTGMKAFEEVDKILEKLELE